MSGICTNVLSNTTNMICVELQHRRITGGASCSSVLADFVIDLTHVLLFSHAGSPCSSGDDHAAFTSSGHFHPAVSQPVGEVSR